MSTALAPPSKVGPRSVQMPPLSIRAAVASINEEERSVELIFSTGAPVERFDWMSGKRYLETLSLDPAHVRVDRLNAGGPLLDSHSAWSVADQLGAVVPGSVRLLKNEARASVRFSKREAVEGVWQDVRDGIISSVSVGYRVYKFVETEGKGNALPVRLAIDWEPFETSLVPIPADAGAKVREGKSSDANTCEIVPLGYVARAAAEAPPPAAPPKTQVAGATTMKETKPMEDARSQTIVEGNPLPIPSPQNADPVEKTDRTLGAEAERARVEHIRVACEAGKMTRAFEAALIKEGVNEIEASRRVFEEIRKREVDVPRAGGGSRPDIRVGDDPLIHVRAGIANALLHRIASERHKLEDVGLPYRGMSILDIGKVFLSARGVRITSLSRSDLVDMMLGRAGMHSTSDFPSLLEDVARKNLRSAYEAAPQTWLPIAQALNLADFKPSRQLQIGDAPGLDEILEHGEVTQGTITEAKETVQLKTYGKSFAITRQALINDDLNAFGQVPALFGRKARDKESDLAWAQITSNPTMGDGNALFDATNHLNLTASGTAISVDSLGVGRAALRKQKGIDGVTPLNLSPRFLIAPAGKETIADQYVTQITPAASSNVNPFGPSGRTPLVVIVEPRLDAASATAWYMACGADQAPVLYYATLDGQSGPDLRQEEGFDIDGMKFRCRIDVAFKAADWHAIYKNAGA